MSKLLPTAKYRKFIDSLIDDIAFPLWNIDSKTISANIWIEAQLLHESSGNPFAIHQDSSIEFSLGLGQIENTTYAEYHKLANKYLDESNLAPLLRPKLNIHWTVIINADNLALINQHSKATVEALLECYNGGPNAIGKDPDYVAAVKAQIAKVLEDL